MHRSGTSAAARALNLCGLPLPQDLLRPGHDNPEGFWEPRAVVALHDLALRANGLAWHDPRPLPRDWFESLLASGIRFQLWQSLAADLERTGTLLVKDPRMCRLVPLWRRLCQDCGLEPRCILAVRNPLDVAASLARRNDMPEPKALLLWLRHVLEAERDSRDLPRGFLSYDGLLKGGVKVLDQALRQAGIEAPRPMAEAEREVATFVNAAHRHHHAEEDALARAPVSDWVRSAFRWMQRAAAGASPDPAILDKIHEALRSADLLFAPLLPDPQPPVPATSAGAAPGLKHWPARTRP